MTAVVPTIFVVDDDRDLCAVMERALRHEGLSVATFGSPSELFAAFDVQAPGCIVLDLRLPEMNGLEMQSQLAERGSAHPFIVVSGYGDVPTAVEAMRQGAVDFLEKPWERQRLLDAVRTALNQDATLREQINEEQRVASRLSRLTTRERQVLDFVAAGLLTKQIAAQLGLSPKTVEVHRSRIMSKLNVDSIVQLTKLLLTDQRRQGREAKSRHRAPQRA